MSWSWSSYVHSAAALAGAATAGLVRRPNAAIEALNAREIRPRCVGDAAEEGSEGISVLGAMCAAEYTRGHRARQVRPQRRTGDCEYIGDMRRMRLFAHGSHESLSLVLHLQRLENSATRPVLEELCGDSFETRRPGGTARTMIEGEWKTAMPEKGWQ
jgi:hypothetical protein